MKKPSPCPLIEISGTPRERGRQYGAQARERVKLGIEHYTEQLSLKAINWDEIRELALHFEPTIARFDPAYIEEMKGIAEGAGVDYAGIVLLNARTEILKLGEQRSRLSKQSDEATDGCTGVVVLPSATANGKALHAINWDWKLECVDTAVVLKVRREDGPDFLTFTEAGALARTGMNAAGVTITANYLESDRDYTQLGVPLPFIRRKVLEQPLVGQAMQVVYTTPKSCSNNMIVAHRAGIALDFECAPDETFLVHARDGLLVHANHFQSPVALSKLVEQGVKNMPDSLYRDIRVDDLIRPHIGKVTREILVEALLDDFQTPWAVCRPPRPSVTSNLTATVATVVMEPASGWMGVAMLPSLYPEFTSYGLDIDPDPTNIHRKYATFL